VAQIVRRVWHEPFPATAVLEQKATLTRSGGALTRTPFPTQMPFRCDNVVAFLRGFHLRYLGDEPRPLGTPRVSVRVERSDSGLSVVPDGEFGTDDYVLDVYFTLVAWEQSMFHLHAAPFNVQHSDGDIESDEDLQFVTAQVRDPCPETRGDCGRVFAAPSSIALVTSLNELERWSVASSPAGRHVARRELQWPVRVALWQSEADIFLYQWQIAGTFLTGPDLPLSVAFTTGSHPIVPPPEISAPFAEQ